MSLGNPKFRAAAVQAAPVFLDLEGTVDKCIALIEEAARNGAALIAFPETFIPGYPWYIWLDSAAWSMQFVQRYFDNSLTYGSPLALRLARAARDNEIMVALGLSERAGGSLYMGQWIIGSDGNTILRRRKLKPTFVERIVYGEGDGTGLSVSDTPLGRVGALCCWEHLQPLSKYAMYAQNEQVHIAAWPSFSIYPGAAHQLSAEVNTSASRIYATEGSCFVIAPCATVSAEMIALMCTDETKRALLHEGGGYAQIYGPDGRLISDALDPREEGLVYADIDLGLIPLAKAAADPAGHYARPDVTRLLLNKAPNDPVVVSSPAVSRISSPAVEEIEPAWEGEPASDAILPEQA